MARVVRSEEVAPQAWAAGGTTRELLVADDGSWRVGLAEVVADGPLPAVPGRRRLLTVVEGPVLGLDVDGKTLVLEPHRPFACPGDAAAVASVPEGPVRVLDVVVDPAVTPYVTVLELGRTTVLPLAADQAAFVVKGGSAEAGAGSLVAGPGEVSGRATVAVVTLERG